MSNTFVEIVKSQIEKFNPYHDRLGRFTTASGAASMTYKPGASAAHDKAIAREKERTKASDEANANSNSGAPSLNKDLVRRANSASYTVDAGDATSREYSKNVKAIQEMNLTAEQKTEAVKQLHSLTEKQLSAEAANVSPYTSGRARINQQQVRDRADTAAKRRQDVKSYMDSLKRQSDNNTKTQQDNELRTALSGAMSRGDLVVNVGGKTYYRSRRNSSTWNVR